MARHFIQISKQLSGWILKYPQYFEDLDTFRKNFTDPDPKRIRPFQKIIVESHKIQIISMTDIAIASKLSYFGNLFGYKRNLTQKYQKTTNYM